jgi:hypothetical protein
MEKSTFLYNLLNESHDLFGQHCTTEVTAADCCFGQWFAGAIPHLHKPEQTWDIL